MVFRTVQEHILLAPLNEPSNSEIVYRNMTFSNTWQQKSVQVCIISIASCWWQPFFNTIFQS